MEPRSTEYTRKAWIYVICLLITLDCYFHVLVYYDVLFPPRESLPKKRNSYNVFETHYPKFEVDEYYMYPLVFKAKVSMWYGCDPYNSSYYWFTSMKPFFKDVGAEARPRYLNDTPICKLNTSFAPITVANKTEPKVVGFEQQKPDVKLGGYYAPTHCRAASKVAVIIPYRDRCVNFKSLLRYLHALLQKQLVEYRIFVIEQFGTEKVNKGRLYNIAFLETQRFGSWDCLVFHDMDRIVEDKDIPYSCLQRPENFSPSVELYGFREYRSAIGSVTAVSPKDYEAMGGYSNTHPEREEEFYNSPQLFGIPSPTDLRSTKYHLLNVTEEKLYTHILADASVFIHYLGYKQTN
ncbi:beta-1,4-galactosyltransferase 4-like [Helicoverpa zea]|uniref:beta-1,4-galactosyltransferase 4-like n=1 Tax=Helicoverpa zea TaxID=7113 RepID=UPI001F5A650D|nr:beta-1,4-galactosyltransferase 4-like [Helicoverpa zea]